MRVVFLSAQQRRIKVGRMRLRLKCEFLYAPTKMHVYEVRPRKDHRSINVICDMLPFGRLWYGEPNAMSNAFNRNGERAIKARP
jgi:hypothetical protein